MWTSSKDNNLSDSGQFRYNLQSKHWQKNPSRVFLERWLTFLQNEHMTLGFIACRKVLIRCCLTTPIMTWLGCMNEKYIQVYLQHCTPYNYEQFDNYLGYSSILKSSLFFSFIIHILFNLKSKMKNTSINCFATVTVMFSRNVNLGA